MMPYRYLPIVLFILFFYFPAEAQEDNFVRDLIENLTETLSDDVDFTELTERLNLYASHPLDLNNASEKQLHELYFLSPLQINKLLGHIRDNGKLIDMLELQGIDGLDLLTIERLKKFTKVTTPNPLKKVDENSLLHAGRNDILVRYGQLLQTQKGFRNLSGSRYLGSKDKILIRYRYNFSRTITAGLLMEKDAGEYLVTKTTFSDHLTGNIALNDVGRVKRLVLGDYSLQFGQGLTLWSGFSFGKSPDVTGVAARDLGLKPYSSANESSFFRGIAGTFDLGNHLLLTTFLSSRKRDASLKLNADSSYSLQTLNITGLHRTQTELNNRNSVGQSAYGAVIQFSSAALVMGIIAYNSGYQHAFVTGNAQNNKYSFTGKNLINTGFHYGFTYKNIYSYGEMAQSIGSGRAIINGLLISISPKLSGAVLFRDYQKDYHNFFSSGIGENTEVANEKGLYTGINFSPKKQFTYSLYVDIFKFPWLKYRVDAPSSGHEELFQVIYNPMKTWKMTLRLKQEQKSQNPDASDKVPGLKKVLKQSFRLGCDWKLSSTISWQHRLELAGYKKGNAHYETGKVIYSDMNYKQIGFPVSGNLRLAWFSSPSYNSRIYAYEDDVLYASTSGLYFNTGIRTYVNLRYQLSRSINIWARYAAYFYKNQEVTGSGLDEINGNLKSDVRFQVRYEF
ncbi:helix-hairpin-helix domain-containing protein [Pedobacter sp. PWIIR3]